MTITVLIADDHAAVRAGLRALLEDAQDLEIAGDAADGLEAVEAVSRFAPDIVLLDVQMPRLTGIEAIHRIRRASPSTKVIVLTTFAIDAYVDEALAAGASAFLVKTVSSSGLIDAIRRVHGGEAVLAPEVTKRIIERFASTGSVPPAPSTFPDAAALVDELTPRELDVLALLGIGLSNADIADRLVVSEATSRTHVSRVLAKLGLTSRVQAAIVAHETGAVRNRP